jgi:hypothetical protein
MLLQNYHTTRGYVSEDHYLEIHNYGKLQDKDGRKLFLNVDSYLPDNTVSYPRIRNFNIDCR